MNITTSIRRGAYRLAAVTLVLAGSVGCGIEKQSAPPLTGPSEFGTSIRLLASPDVVTRDGESQSTILVEVTDAAGAPVPNQPLILQLAPSNGGTLSTSQVTTGADGRATFTFTAPPLTTNVTAVEIGATPVGSNIVNALTRTVRLALLAPAAADPSFTVTPTSPQRFQVATLDASGTTLDGTACGSSCTYAWTIGTEANLTGQVVTHRFQQQATYVVTLNVTAPGGITTSTQQNVVVTAATSPTASFTFSPTNPRVGDTVFFNATASTAAGGATISEYTWDFGNGATGSGATPSVVYAAARSFIVRLTVRDSNGLTGTTTQTVTVATP